jgi:type IV pilus assembly protein PilB
MHFVQYLVEKKNVNDKRLAEVASQEFGVPLFDIHAFNLSAIPDGLVDVDLVTKHHAMPLFRRGNRLFIAVSDPTNLAALDEIKFHTGINTDAVLIEEKALNRVINNWVETQDTLGDGLDDLDSDDLEGIDVAPAREGDEDDDGEGIDETPIVRPLCASLTRY